MAKRLTEKALIKKLDTLSREELTKITVDLFKTNKLVEMKMNFLILAGEWTVISQGNTAPFRGLRRSMAKNKAAQEAQLKQKWKCGSITKGEGGI